ncbi:chlorophyll a-b binding protein, chloroplastic-like [Iris pallida]|uniref:Chlorophyll a-b binding protein, chloroplastic n=1 Tax=Iris pallida TaxID=29817 RepID=A0AAX6IIT4_IRIPA|nr:chlorophyll a-b binding protein, chloroplastic-like [Iris pallida]KAJ6853122.1 chlorophyll a-b binding protein, chloroplastic-like [Iris pallida]
MLRFCDQVTWCILVCCIVHSSQNGLSATKASFFGGRKLHRQGKWKAPTGRRTLSVSAAAATERPIWFPGSVPPPWLDGSLPGDFGFDPLGLSSDPESLKWNVQAEIVHCRWAMLGAAGIFIPELLTKIGILNTPSWYTAGEQEYFTDTTTLFLIELILIGWAGGGDGLISSSPGVSTPTHLPKQQADWDRRRLPGRVLV